MATQGEKKKLDVDRTVGADCSPFVPHSTDDIETMLEAIDANTVEELFDIPESIRYDGRFDIDSMSEQAVRRHVAEILEQNESPTSFLGRNYYSHYVPSIVDYLSLRSEFITSYTQYQPEITQGFLQALFEYQSMLVELTGLEIANCSMYDSATALGEAATLAKRLRQITGDRVLVPDYIREGDLAVLENYTDGIELTVETFGTENGMVDPDVLEDAIDSDVVLVYVENPTVDGVIEEHLDDVGRIVDAAGALYCLGSDLVALSLLQSPASVGADIVIGDASVLGLPHANGMGLGIFACRAEFLRQVPGRLVGASEGPDGGRAYTLTLQTREQHIRRERATSNICTNQAWVALRTAIHAASLGPDGLMALAERCHRLSEQLAAELDEIEGVSAPVRECHHFREFRASVDADAVALTEALADRGFSIHAVDENQIQLCVTDLNAHRTDDLVTALEEVLA